MRKLFLALLVPLAAACSGDFSETTMGSPFFQQESPRPSVEAQEEATVRVRPEAIDRVREGRPGIFPRGMFGDRPVSFDQESKSAVVGDEVIPLPIPDNRIFFQGGPTIAWVEDDKEHITVMDLRDRSLETIQVRRGFAALEVTNEGEPIIMTSDGWVPLRSN